MGCILDDRGVPDASLEFNEIATMAAVVNRNDRTGARRDEPRGFGGIEVAVGIDVRETNSRPAKQERVHGRGNRERRHDHLVAGTDSEQHRRQLERMRRGADQQHLAAEKCSEELLAPARERIPSGPGGREHLREPLRLRADLHWSRERNVSPCCEMFHQPGRVSAPTKVVGGQNQA